ncbi:hypothetical protein BJ508DRAFT_417757 [Ascobolus immersus RN42]|uniref:Uncharacterized protein n=1 Tax=Ascobolus immersus RN42 TaxID=1160509 RepID=A0A3N4HVN1_ASCIM|nr:hypothetical protein BJ508DRAFT_417757 [Ascobolus immersus RN42]
MPNSYAGEREGQQAALEAFLIVRYGLEAESCTFRRDVANMNSGKMETKDPDDEALFCHDPERVYILAELTAAEERGVRAVLMDITDIGKLELRMGISADCRRTDTRDGNLRGFLEVTSRWDSSMAGQKFGFGKNDLKIMLSLGEACGDKLSTQSRIWTYTAAKVLWFYNYVRNGDEVDRLGVLKRRREFKDIMASHFPIDIVDSYELEVPTSIELLNYSLGLDGRSSKPIVFNLKPGSAVATAQPGTEIDSPKTLNPLAGWVSVHEQELDRGLLSLYHSVPIPENLYELPISTNHEWIGLYSSNNYLRDYERLLYQARLERQRADIESFQSGTAFGRLVQLYGGHDDDSTPPFPLSLVKVNEELVRFALLEVPFHPFCHRPSKALECAFHWQGCACYFRDFADQTLQKAQTILMPRHKSGLLRDAQIKLIQAAYHVAIDQWKLRIRSSERRNRADTFASRLLECLLFEMRSERMECLLLKYLTEEGVRMDVVDGVDDATYNQ